jgi:NADPH:quinone reductase-like Zn-dependent oxidoreductase
VLGASTVVAVARPASADRASAAGADVVVPLDEDAGTLTAALAEHGPYDVVLDPVFGTAATAAGRVLAPLGRLVNLGGAAGDHAVFSSAVLRSRSVSVLGYTNNSLSAAQRAEAIEAVLAHAAAGRIGVQYAERPLSDVEDAWRDETTGGSSLRCVLLPGSS